MEKTWNIFLVVSRKCKTRKVKSYLMWDSMKISWDLIEEVSGKISINFIKIPILAFYFISNQDGICLVWTAIQKVSVIFRGEEVVTRTLFNYAYIPDLRSENLQTQEKINIGLLDTVERISISIGDKKEKPSGHSWATDMGSRSFWHGIIKYLYIEMEIK